MPEVFPGVPTTLSAPSSHGHPRSVLLFRQTSPEPADFWKSVADQTLFLYSVPKGNGSFRCKHCEFHFAHKQFHVCLERNPMIPSGKLIPQIRFIFFLESSIQNFRYTYFRACLKFSFFNRRIGSLMRQCFFSCQTEEKHHKNHTRQPFEYPYHNFLYLYSLLMAFTAFSFCFLYAAITLSSDCSSCLLLIVPSMIKHT